jgi:hypothetical protein
MRLIVDTRRRDSPPFPENLSPGVLDEKEGAELVTSQILKSWIGSKVGAGEGGKMREGETRSP